MCDFHMLFWQITRKIICIQIFNIYQIVEVIESEDERFVSSVWFEDRTKEIISGKLYDLNRFDNMSKSVVDHIIIIIIIDKKKKVKLKKENCFE